MNDIQKIKEIIKNKRDKVSALVEKINSQIDEQGKINKDLDGIEKSLQTADNFFKNDGRANISEAPESYLKDKSVEELREMVRKSRDKVWSNIAGSKDSNADLYALLEQLEDEIKERKTKTDAEIKKLKDEKELLEKDIKEVLEQLKALGGDIDGLESKVNTSTENTTLIKSRTGSIVLIGLSVLGVFSAGYWTISGIKKWVDNYRSGRSN